MAPRPRGTGPRRKSCPLYATRCPRETTAKYITRSPGLSAILRERDTVGNVQLPPHPHAPHLSYATLLLGITFLLICQPYRGEESPPLHRRSPVLWSSHIPVRGTPSINSQRHHKISYLDVTGLLPLPHLLRDVEITP